eukprot:8114857-Heterocapsa_arctica.AAC.1
MLGKRDCCPRLRLQVPSHSHAGLPLGAAWCTLGRPPPRSGSSAGPRSRPIRCGRPPPRCGHVRCGDVCAGQGPPPPPRRRTATPASACTTRT